MKIKIAAATLIFAAVPGFSQSGLTGVSRPDSSPSSTEIEQTAKPSAARAVQPSALVTRQAAASPEVYGAYVPYNGPKSAGSAMAAVDPDVAIANADGQIVMSVPEREGEVREGTLLRVRLQEGLSTLDTVRGSRFTATLTEAVMKDGRVVLPVGAVLGGLVTEVHSGKRISGAAALHLEPNEVTMPDGTHYVVHAQLIDTDQMAHVRVDREGTLLRKDHAKETLAIVGATTGAGAIAGGLIGGGVGAVVGAGIGAGASTIVWLRQDRQAVVPKDAKLIFSLSTPMILRPLATGTMSSLAGTSATSLAAAQ
jgi:hypothetical protein